VHAELLLLTGEISEAFAYGICARAMQDGRTLRIFYFADFDPSGWQMSVSLARKLQAHIVREFPDLDVRLIRVAMTVEQVRQFGLPDSPIKRGDKRAAAWRERWGCEQVEIDALAALRPALLAQITRDTLAPYYDATLVERFAAVDTFPPHVGDWLHNLPAHQAATRAIRARHKQMREVAAALNAAVRDGSATVRSAVASAEDRPEVPPVKIAPIVPPEPERDTVFDSREDFVTATRRLQQLKRYSGEEDDETSD
jgi:hypothetical protein